MEEVILNKEYTLSSGLKIVPFKKRYCWHLCTVIKQSNQKVFKVNDIVAVSNKALIESELI